MQVSSWNLSFSALVYFALLSHPHCLLLARLHPRPLCLALAQTELGNDMSRKHESYFSLLQLSDMKGDRKSPSPARTRTHLLRLLVADHEARWESHLTSR